jgi:hypothetical protein
MRDLPDVAGLQKRDAANPGVELGTPVRIGGDDPTVAELDDPGREPPFDHVAKAEISPPEIREREMAVGLLEICQDRGGAGGKGVEFVERVRSVPLGQGTDRGESVEDVGVEAQHLPGEGTAGGQFPHSASLGGEGIEEKTGGGGFIERKRAGLCAGASSVGDSGLIPEHGEPLGDGGFDTLDRLFREGGFQFRSDGSRSGLAFRRGMEERLPRHGPTARIDAHGALDLTEKRLRGGRVVSFPDSDGSSLDPFDERRIVAFPCDLSGHPQPGLGLVVEGGRGEGSDHQEDRGERADHGGRRRKKGFVREPS